MSATTSTLEPRPELIARDVIPQLLIRYRREGCRIARLIIQCDPERIDETIFDFLRRIEGVRIELIRSWLRAASIDPLREGRELKSWQRHALAAQLLAYERGQS